MTRRSFVQVEGKLWEKTGDNSAIINGELWHCYAGRWAAADSVRPAGVTIIADIQPYKSMIDGSMITSRSHHRDHLRAHNCIETGNEPPKPRQNTWTATKGLREELIARIKN